MKTSKRKHTIARVVPDLACECGGRLRPVVFPEYDFSGYAGYPIIVRNLPGFRCTKCEGETIDGKDINVVLNAVAMETAKSPNRLDADQARFLRRRLAATQQELADRMGIARETVAKWECGEAPISPQHDLILRVIAVAPQVVGEGGLVTEKVAADLMAHFQSVRTAPPAPREPMDLSAYLEKRKAAPTVSPTRVKAASAG